MKGVQSIYRIIIHITAAFLASKLYSYFTTMLVLFGIEKGGGDLGSPGIMLVLLFGLCVAASFSIAIVMEYKKPTSKKELSVKTALIIFLLTYFPIHIAEYYFPGQAPGFLAIPLTLLMFFSFIPLYYTIAQSLFNIFEYLKILIIKGSKRS
ncbi:MAG: hypothetical protein OEZ01_17600 [Candidatus Heimdallarchaeota archaeon]|nr:hypothetical protein [Candidatus Heimdallarchaeota archaeon]